MASALVQMTPFSPSQMSDIMMMMSDHSFESFPGLRDEPGSKRTGTSDGDEDQDRSHVKKRRKQSKPNRITSAHPVSDSKLENGPSVQDTNDFDFSETGEHFLSDRLATFNHSSLTQTEEYQDRSHINQEHQTNSYNDNQSKSALSENVYGSTVPLNLSNIKSSIMDSIVTPLVSENKLTNDKNVSLESNQLQLQPFDSSKTSITPENSYLSQSLSHVYQSPLFKHSPISNQIPPISSNMRIFNPEAFCDLCNKEFCNKYFLKTHKANKHGIYTENQCGPSILDPMPSLPFTNYFSTNSESYDNPQSYQTTSSAKIVIPHNQINYPARRSPPKKTQILPQQQSSIFIPKTGSTGNMRALCNICQREFCNKYFVRRHKLKIHGIIEPPSKDSSSIDMQENNSVNNNSSQDKLDFFTNEGEIYKEYVKQITPSNFSTDVREPSQSLEIKEEDFKEKLEKGLESETQSVQISRNTSTPTEISPMFQTSQNEENNKENNLCNIKSKKFGVVNADAFCDICCKEYCNKYFLRTHKLKSHGILPVDDKKEDVINGSNYLSWYQTQSMPLNLIVNDHATSNKDISDSINFDAEGDECVCNMCGRYFENQFLLKMHVSYSHSSKYPSDENIVLVKQQSNQNEDTNAKGYGMGEKSSKQLHENYLPEVKSENWKELIEEKPKDNTENLKKLQTLISRLNSSNGTDNSTCDVCEKDLGHLSLMENHILKEHTLLLEELGNFTEEENSSSYNSLASTFKKECPYCQKTFFKSSLLEKHLKEEHNDMGFLTEAENILSLTKKPAESTDTSALKSSSLTFPLQPSEDRQGLQTPTNSFCEICKKELCNKYFMKTHMQRMHGISIENGAQIGGVVCDICNKELCSKYFLRVHKQNSHGIVDELFLPQLGLDFGRNQSPNADPSLKPTDQGDLSHRYFTHFNEVCSICNRRFRSAKWLKAHLWNDHGEEGKEKCKDVFLPANSDSKISQFEDSLKEISKKIEFPTIFGTSNNQLAQALNSAEVNQNVKDMRAPLRNKGTLAETGVLNSSAFSKLMNGGDSEMKQYQCSYCPFTTTILAFLFIHERSHVNTSFPYSSEQPTQCPICFQNIESKEHFEKHVKLHSVAWQASYTLNNSNQELIKSQGSKSETMNDVIICTTPDAIGVTRQDQSATENLSLLTKSDSTLLENNHPELAPELTMQCTRCRFNSTNVQDYLNHLNKEHPYIQMDQELPSYIQQMEKALSTLACNAGIPAVFAVPRMQDSVTMQPFVLEDSEHSSDMNNSITKKGNTFLSSLVFLPVKEKLKNSVTASFKLTPT